MVSLMTWLADGHSHGQHENMALQRDEEAESI